MEERVKLKKPPQHDLWANSAEEAKLFSFLSRSQNRGNLASVCLISILMAIEDSVSALSPNFPLGARPPVGNCQGTRNHQRWARARRRASETVCVKSAGARTKHGAGTSATARTRPACGKFAAGRRRGARPNVAKMAMSETSTPKPVARVHSAFFATCHAALLHAPQLTTSILRSPRLASR
jgi:hypothetical protein